MKGGKKYYMLVASLPYMPPSFEVESVPIGKRQLDQRLRMLQPGDAEVVTQVLSYLQWDRLAEERSDEEVRHHYHTLIKSSLHPLVREIINYRTDVRTITAGLRRRRLNLQPSPGVGRFAEHVQQHWSQPDFSLGRQHPWIARVDEKLRDGETLSAERELLGVTWNMWTRLASRTFFTFERVVLYLAQWEIIERWTRLNEAVGRERFDLLLEQSLGQRDENDA